jgi:hypothetical protein
MGTVYNSQQYVEILYQTIVSHEVSAGDSITVDSVAECDAVFGITSAITVTPLVETDVTCVIHVSSAAVIDILAAATGLATEIFDRPVESTLSIDVAVVGSTVLSRVADAEMAIVGVSQATRAISPDGAASLAIDAVVGVQCVFSRECAAEVQSTTSELDTDTYAMVDVITGLDCTALASRPLAVSAVQPVGITVSASKVLVYPDAIDLSASAEVSLDCTAAKNEYGAGLAWLLLTATVTVDKCQPVVAYIEVGATADVLLTASREAVAEVDIDFSVTYLVESSCIEFEYHPFVGSGAEDAPTPPPITLSEPLEVSETFKLVYPAAGAVTDSVTLRAPQFGNRDRIGINRINRETRGGTLVVYADPIWPKTQTLVLSFAGLTRGEAVNLLTFYETYLGDEIGLLDWEHRYWKGVITQPDAVIQDGRDSYSASFEFEGELDPSWTP